MPEPGDQKANQREQTHMDEASRRATGEAFDERMKEFTQDAPRAVRPDQKRRKRR